MQQHRCSHVTTGIEVEMVIPPAQSAPRIVASEELGPLALFHSYATTVGMTQPAIEAAQKLLDVSLLTSDDKYNKCTMSEHTVKKCTISSSKTCQPFKQDSAVATCSQNIPVFVQQQHTSFELIVCLARCGGDGTASCCEPQE